MSAQLLCSTTAPVLKISRFQGKSLVKIRRKTTMTVTKDSIIGDVLDHNPETAQFFFEIGMHCLGCPSARGESIADACMVHGTDADALIAKINAFLNK
jgi:hybrid cluster-associated redox disulfide protein